MNIAITGPAGLVGSRIIELLGDKHSFLPLGHLDVDVTSKESVETALRGLDYDLLLHLAAYTNVDKAEIEPDQAHLLNVTATKHVFDATQSMNKKFVYISTDFVFSGNEDVYDEQSTPNPIGMYGKTKYLGEQIVKDRAMIVRISYPYRGVYEKRSDFYRTIRSLLSSGKSIGGITDSIITPTFIDDIAHSLDYLMTHFSPEVYHVVGGDSMSPYDAFRTIADTAGLSHDLIRRITYDEFFSGKAQRPRNGKTISTKNTFHPMKTFREGLVEIEGSVK